MADSNETLRAGDRVEIRKLEGWKPTTPFTAVVEKVTRDIAGNEAFVLRDGEQRFGLTQRAPASFRLQEMAFHELDSAATPMDPCSGVGFVRVTRC